MSRVPLTEKRNAARDLYINRGLKQRDIAKLVGVNERTIVKWKTADQWDAQQAAYVTSKGKELLRLYAQVKQMNDAVEARPDGARFASAKEADALNKLASAIRKLENETGLASSINVFISFNDWLRIRDLQMAQKVNDLQDQYIKHLLAK